MIHIAIMKKSWGLTKKILLGEKIVETRWYMHKRDPWNKIKAGEKVYFKDSGEPVTVTATISKVEQFEDINDEKIAQIMKKYSKKDLGTNEITEEIEQYVKGKRYAIIVHLIDPKSIKPFGINKKGFGLMSAWLCVERLSEVRID